MGNLNSGVVSNLHISLKNALNGTSGKVKLNVWNHATRVEVIEAGPSITQQSVVVVVDKKPRKRLPHSFLLKLIVARQKLYELFPSREVIILLVLDPSLEE